MAKKLKATEAVRVAKAVKAKAAKEPEGELATALAKVTESQAVNYEEYIRQPVIPGCPQFLRDAALAKPSLTKADLKALLDQQTGAKRDWVMPDKNKPREKPVTPLFVDNRAAPVEVVYSAPKGKAGTMLLKRFADMAEFEKDHDFKSYPVRQAVCSQELTLILVNPKPWAGRIAAVPGIDDPSPPTARQERKAKAARNFSQPDAAGKPVTQGSSLGTILGLMLAGDRTMEQIIKESGVEGGVVSAEDKVLHRIRFVLFRQHGVGHAIDEAGKVKAVLPSGFDKVSIYKVAKDAKAAKVEPVAPAKPEPKPAKAAKRKVS